MVTRKLPGVTRKLPEKKSNFEEEKNHIECLYCRKIFKFKSGLSRHQNHRCKAKQETDDRVKILEKQLSHALSIADNNSKTVKKSMSTINYAIQHFNDAPAIGLLEGKRLDGFIEYNGNTDKPIEQIIIHHFEKKKLHQLLGDLIVKEYKKNNPNKQSVWTRHYWSIGTNNSYAKLLRHFHASTMFGILMCQD
jgi:hypothetical protein